MNRYLAVLSGLPPERWDAYLTENSGLPGPRANLALADAFATVASRESIVAHANSSDEYLRFCGTQALGMALAAEPHDAELIAILRERASDENWRVREASARGLQFVGDARPELLCFIAARWMRDADPYVRRAAVAALCEPRLLVTEAIWQCAMMSCIVATASITNTPLAARRDAGLRNLRQALGYCWSVVVAAAPDRGISQFERLRASADPDVEWIVRSNLSKARLRRLMVNA
ncbi:hypothetical protein HDC94_001025 [Leifsonia sp. AK011]|uniref:HEAT repeat domain-containing protein n=1 Tax=Leifsonia sp. AK011 TaxID=2723075 RepID=UPI0015C7D9F5|nr:HEAT repeat domain-containing protein [Leifsonia sp. AK011]NYF09869.1 hypothetical protein [Leifsonia sp. AK011]